MRQCVICVFLIGAALTFFPSVTVACETREVTVSGNLDSRVTPIDEVPDFASDVDSQISEAQLSVDIGIIDPLGVEHAAKLLFYRVANGQTAWLVRVLVTDERFVTINNGIRVWGDVNLAFDDAGQRVLLAPPDTFGSFSWLSGTTNGYVEMTFLPTNTEQASNIRIDQDGRTGGCTQFGNLDYDGDGKDDFAIFRPALGIWAILKSSTEQTDFIFKQWGLPGDYPMPGDYTGDGVADLVVWRPSNGTWYVCRSDSSFSCSDPDIVQFGLPGDIPIEGDFDGDRVLDHAVWRPSNGAFYYRRSFNSEVIERQWGLKGDVPLQGGRAE